MPSSWDVYYVVFLSAFLALGVPAFLALISRFMSPRRRQVASEADAAQTAERLTLHQGKLGQRINARFFLGVNAALVLITLGLALIPCVGILQHPESAASAVRALVAIVTLAAFSGMGLLYSATKGDLSWIGSFTSESKRTEKQDVKA